MTDIAALVAEADGKKLAGLLNAVESEGTENLFHGAFNNESWEYIVTDMLNASTDRTSFVPLREIDPYYDSEGMIKVGYLRRTEKGYELTEAGLQKISRYLSLKMNELVL